MHFPQTQQIWACANEQNYTEGKLPLQIQINKHENKNFLDTPTFAYSEELDFSNLPEGYINSDEEQNANELTQSTHLSPEYDNDSYHTCDRSITFGQLCLTRQAVAPPLRVSALSNPTQLALMTCDQQTQSNVKVEHLVSDILKLFRKDITNRFDKIFCSQGHRAWTESAFRKNVKAFFTQKETNPSIKEGYSFSTKFYDENEIIFVAIIQKNRALKKIWYRRGLSLDVINFARNTLKDVFGKSLNEYVFIQSPNQQNLKQFFRNPLIQALWWPDENIALNESNTFNNSNSLKSFLKKQDMQTKQNLYQYFEQIEAEREILNV